MANGQPNVKRANVQPATALITGITGQDGSYTSAALSTSLAEFLLYKGYEVHGIIRRTSTFNTRRLDHIYRDAHNGEQVHLHLHYGDIGSAGNLIDMIHETAVWVRGVSSQYFGVCRTTCPPNPPTLGGICSPRIGGRGAFPKLLR